MAPWSGGPVDDLEQALAHADEIGFPLLVKAAAGGGGRGIRRVDSPDRAGERVRPRPRRGPGGVRRRHRLLEKLITPARHVEVQVIADGEGTAWALGVRDCSLQRRSQKVIEESASTALTAEQERELEQAAVRMVLRAGYRNAATVEFLYQPEERSFSFMEVNARLQVEHPVTEAVTGARPGQAPAPRRRGRATRGRAARPGRARDRGAAQRRGSGARLRAHARPGRAAAVADRARGCGSTPAIAEGDAIPAEFDSMVAKVIAWGNDRDEALARLRRAIARDDGRAPRRHDQPGLPARAARPPARCGRARSTTPGSTDCDCGGEAEPARYSDVALLQAAIETSETVTALERASFYAFARRGRPAGRRRDRAARSICATAATGTASASRRSARSASGSRRTASPASSRSSVSMPTSDASSTGGDVLSHRHLRPGRPAPDRGQRRPAPGVAGRSRLRPQPRPRGRRLDPGRARRRGRPRRRGGRAREHEDGELADRAVPRARARGPGAAERAGASPRRRCCSSIRSRMGRSASRPRASPSRATRSRTAERPPRCRAILERLEWLVLGYDVDAGEGRRLAAELDAACGDLMGCDPLLVPGEHQLLDVFADLRSADPAPARIRRSRGRAAAQPAGVPAQLPALARCRRRRGCRRGSWARSSAPSATTASRASSARPSSSAPAIGCSCRRSERMRPAPP